MKIHIKEMDDDTLLWKGVLSTHYNMNYNKTRSYEPIVKLLMSSYGYRKEKEIRSLVTNTARGLSSGAFCIKIPRRKDAYSGNVQGISYQRMMDLLDLLENDGYVNLYLGGVSSWVNGEPYEKETSITELTQKFTDLFRNLDLSAVVCKNPADEVEIKERGTKKVMSTQGVKGVASARQTVFDFNTALVEARISLKGIDLPDQRYKRVFIENLKTGGRWYNVAGGVQTMDKTYRPFLQIDGEDLQELDFKAMHANLLYQEMNAQLPKEFDPYGIDLWENYVDPNMVHQFMVRHGVTRYDPGRNLVKMAVMIGLNAKDEKGAIRALSQKLGQDRNKHNGKDEHKCLYYGIRGEDLKDIYKRILEHNALISDKFFSDVGVHLQYLDSEILESVICDVLAIGEIILPYHDGLLVKQSIAGQVREFMYKAWYKKFNSIQFCKVEVK